MEKKDDYLGDLRYAHDQGISCLSYHDGGEMIVTGGADGDIRVWKDHEDHDPKCHDLGNFVSALALKGDVLYLSSDDCAVSAYSFPGVVFDSIVAQFSTAVYCIACSGRYVAAGGSDFIIKVYDTSDKSLVAFRGHEGPILSLAFDPQMEYLVSSGCDGKVKVWLLSTQETVKTLDLFKKTNDLSPSSTLCCMDWSADGEFLAIPVGKRVAMYARGTFELVKEFTDESIVQDLSVVAISSSSLVCAAGLDGTLVVWRIEGDLELKRVVRCRHPNKVAISGLKWHPSLPRLVYVDTEGQMGHYLVPVSPAPSPSQTRSASPVPPPSKPLSPKKTEKEKQEPENKRKKEEPVKEDFLDFEAMEEGDEDDGAFDIGAIIASAEPKVKDFEEEPPVEKTNEEEVPAPKMFELPPIQTSFQPSSTPLSLERRFMVWNNVGVVRCYNTEEETSIDVEFHDAGTHHPLHLTNFQGHTHAALSPRALLLAAPAQADTPSKLEGLNFASWESKKEWTVELPQDEEVEVLCCSGRFSACVTDRHLLRIFSVAGVQTEVLLVPGPPVACAAHGDRLVIAHHNGQGVEGSQCLGLTLVKVKHGGSTSEEFTLPLSPKSFLTWLGFSDEGSPCAVDTSGRVSVLNTRRGHKWTPVADTKVNLRGKSDTRFVIGLSEAKQEVRYILCKGSRYPALLPRPTVSVLEFSLPFCEMGSEGGKFEEELRRSTLMREALERLGRMEEVLALDKKVLPLYLKMFALSVRGGKESRAKDIHEMLPTVALQQAAIKYASQAGNKALANRLGREMAEKRNEKEESSSSSEEEEEETPPPPSSQPPPTPSLPSIQPKTLLKQRQRTSVPNSSSPAIKSNPFKSPGVTPKREERIDNVLSSSMESVRGGNTNVESKPSRFPTTKRSEASGLALFLSSNREAVEATAPSGASEAEILKVAMKMFKELTKEEKQKYGSKEGKSELLQAKENSPSAPPVKRKEEEGEGDAPLKKLKTAQPATLARFAFTKTPK